MEGELSLYVWHKSLTDYTDGVMFALAHSVEEARAAILEDCSYVHDWEIQMQPTVYKAPVGFAVWGGG